MKLKDISRTATFAWDQSSSSSPLLATGAVAGALDESFSNESQLEIWAPDFGESQGVYLGGEGNNAAGSITVNSRFNRLAWSAPSTTHGRGVLAAGMETGEINVFNPEKILAGASADEARLFTSNKHTGPVLGLDFNPIQKNLLLSGAVNAELFIYDLNNPSNPIPPGAASTKLGEITSLQWNPTVSRIFAASSSSGFTSVWDLKAQKEIVNLQYGGGAAKGMGTVGGVAGLQMGKRRGMSDVCWHPEQATRLITASEDDESPIIMLWDLRNTRAPERILSGHHKGVLSVSWCKQDSDLLLSCGKDNRTLCWNPQTGEIIGELPASSDWSFQTSWCPRNPDLLATASFDGHIGIHSLQTTHVPEHPAQQYNENATADDVFGALGSEGPVDQSENVLSLKQPPKWLRRPVSATFGFGGLLASTSNLPAASGKHQSGVVHLRSVITEQGIIDRASALNEAYGDKDQLSEFCDQRVGEKGDTAWKTLQTLFKANSKEELVQLLGFSKADVATQVEEAIRKFPTTKVEELSQKPEEAIEESEVKEDDKETEKEDGGAETPTSTKDAEANPSEISATSESTKQTEVSETPEHHLFDDHAPGTPGADAADFFSSMAAGGLRNPRLDNIIPHKSEVAESSVAATVGSRGSSVRSEVIKDNTFHIYPSGESEVDRLITQALVLGDFTSAVDLCLASERFADALLLAVRGGPELLQSTQKAYFARRTTSLPFLRVFQSIVTEDLADIVQNAELGEWKVIFVVLCTFAKDSDFNNLADQLGQRLQFKWQMLSNSDSPEAKSSARAAREDATLCYLAARRLEKVVNIWIEEMREEEESTSAPKYTAHAQALQSFVEKVAIFTAATGYVDQDLASPTESAATAESGARSYRLAGLYDRFYEYADLLATQGLVDLAAKYVRKTPSDYKGTGAAGAELDKARERLFRAADVNEAGPSTYNAVDNQRTPQARPPVPNAYTAPTAAPASTPYAPAPAASSAYAPPSNAYQSSAAPRQQAPPIQQSYGYGAPSPYSTQQPASNAYAPQNSYQSAPSPYALTNTYGSGPEPQAQGYGAPPTLYNAPPPPTPLGPPPRAGSVNGSSATPPPIPASQRRDLPGWNDAPSMVPPKRPQSAARTPSKATPIMSPFPMSQDPMANAGLQQPPHGSQGINPPPPRASQPGMLPPPPKGGPRPPSAQALAQGALQRQATPQQSGPPPPQVGGPAPSRPDGPPSGIAGPPPPRGPPGRGGPPPPGVLAGPPPRALSPLGPGGRVAPPIAAQFQPPSQPSQPSRALSPPNQSSPAGVLRGGPPPPGARPAASQSPQAPQGPNTVRATPPPPQAAPSKPSHPAGDRSHIPPTSKPIFDVLSNELNKVKQTNLPPHVKRIADDTERRLNILFDQLNNDTVPKQSLDQMHAITKAISARDANTALAVHVDLLTNATGEMTAWVPGVKQIIRLGV